MPVTDDEHPLGFALAQLHGVYVLAQNRIGLVLVDMHAAHERVLYEKFKAERAASAPASQHLMEPIVVELKGHELDAVLENKAEWESAGFALDALGPTRLALRSVPAMLLGQNIPEIVHSVVRDLELDADVSGVITSGGPRRRGGERLHELRRGQTDQRVVGVGGLTPHAVVAHLAAGPDGDEAAATVDDVLLAWRMAYGVVVTAGSSADARAALADARPLEAVLGRHGCAAAAGGAGRGLPSLSSEAWTILVGFAGGSPRSIAST